MENETDLSIVEEAAARLAILEDVGTGDVTAEIVPGNLKARATVRVKEEGLLSGVGVAVQTFQAIDPEIEVETPVSPGSRIHLGEIVLRARGSARRLLTAERPVLNFLQHLSGIATLTARFVEQVRAAGSASRITDTRKTVPGLRILEKEAVFHGGGVNHRVGLYDAVMIKENHIAAAGSISSAVEGARRIAERFPIIVEVRTLAEAEEAARLAVGRILLDNMGPETIPVVVAAVRRIEDSLPGLEEADRSYRWLPDSWRPGDRPIQIEVSGNLTLENVARYGLPGVDFLSIGRLTHSAPAIDLSIELEPIEG